MKCPLCDLEQPPSRTSCKRCDLILPRKSTRSFGPPPEPMSEPPRRPYFVLLCAVAAVVVLAFIVEGRLSQPRRTNSFANAEYAAQTQSGLK